MRPHLPSEAEMLVKWRTSAVGSKLLGSSNCGSKKRAKSTTNKTQQGADKVQSELQYCEAQPFGKAS
jgi:hypothetical protein